MHLYFLQVLYIALLSLLYRRSVVSDNRYFSTNECEYLAEDELVTVLALFDEPSLELAPGIYYGPFELNQPIDIPLWLALYLKKLNKCRVQYPSWLSMDYLREILRREMEPETAGILCSGLPFYYVEISHLLLRGAANDCEEGVATLRRLLTDLQEIREVKVLEKIKRFELANTPVELTNFVNMEITVNRGFLLHTLNSINAIRNLENGIDPKTGKQLPTPPGQPQQRPQN